MTAEGNAANNAMVQTLNRALGNLGGRQKSWMHASIPEPSPSDVTVKPLPFTVRHQGRPPKHAPQSTHPPQTTEVARPSIESQVVEVQPPSNSTSPQLANVLTGHGTPYHAPSVLTVFPSPTPSEENMDNASVPSLRGGSGAAPVVFREPNAEQANHAPNAPLEVVFIDSSRRAGSGQKRRAEDAGAQTEKRGCFGKNRQDRPIIVASKPHPPPPTLSRPSHAEYPRRTSIPHVLVGRPQPEHTQNLTSSFGQIPNGHVPNTHHAHLRSAWYTHQECLNIMNQFETSFTVTPDRFRDRQRLNVLKKATETQDWSYLIMHQIYCLVDVNSNLLPDIIRNRPGLSQALHVIMDVLGSNKNLSPAVLHFFANYPYPVQNVMARWPETWERQMHLFFAFVALSQNYHQLKFTCERRRFPPLAWELAQYLGLGSTEFQLLFFTAVLRSMWRVPQNKQQSHYEAQAIKLFQQNQVDFYRRLTDGRVDEKHLRDCNESDLRQLGTLLNRVVEEFEVTLRHQGNSTPLPRVAMSPYAQQPQLATNGASMSSRSYQTAQPYSAPPPTQRPGARGRSLTQAIHAPLVAPSQPQMQPSRAPASLLPPRGWIQPQQRQPNPTRFSLHEAHLRSPVLKARTKESPLYHFVQGFIKPPARLVNAGRAVEKWTFTLTAEMTRCIAATVPGPPGEPNRRLIDTQSKTVRLRCVRWPATDLPDDHVWASTDVSWIPHSYFCLNGTSLQQRKKVHHGKDLPIDITGLVKEGDNLLEVTVMAQSKDTSYCNYLVAIEYLGIISHDSVKRHCADKYRIPAQQVLSDIKAKLRASNDDDEIAIVESNLTIGLFDPFSASKMCDIPVRSRACLHNDCFDLETYLTTRRRQGDVSVPDLWRCPICSADARPHHLVVDGFLEEVKQQLDAQGLSQTRAIIVQQDGTWKPKAEVRDPNGVSDRGMSDEPPTPVISRASLPAHAEIIDLSD